MVVAEEIINDVVYNLKRLTGLDDIYFEPVELQRYDYDLTINGVVFACDVKTQVNRANYNLALQQLRIKEMEFADADSRKDRKSIELPEGACWGGEGGAYMIDQYLVPEVFDIYTDVPSIRLMMTKKMKFEEKGRIRVYHKFWKGDENEKVAPKILIYADLMGSGNSRCIEAAQRLVENGI